MSALCTRHRYELAFAWCVFWAFVAVWSLL